MIIRIAGRGWKSGSIRIGPRNPASLTFRDVRLVRFLTERRRRAHRSVPTILALRAISMGRARRARLCLPYDFFHALVSSAISAVAASRIAEGVREKRGAGAGWVTPWRLTKIRRAAMCGWSGASLIVTTGAQHTSV